MITTKCDRCGKNIQPDKYGFRYIICEDCLTYTERYLRKKRMQRINESIEKFEEMFNRGHKNGHEVARVPVITR